MKKNKTKENNNKINKNGLINGFNKEILHIDLLILILIIFLMLVIKKLINLSLFYIF